jgi:hypothetical protein
MAICRLESGHTFVTYDGINQLIAPARVGRFVAPPAVGNLLAEFPVSSLELKALFQAFDAALGQDMRQQGLIFGRAIAIGAKLAAQADAYGRRLFLYPELPAAALSHEFEKSTLPHHTHATELHHIVVGAMIMGLLLSNREQAIIYLQPGETLRLVESVQHWPYDPADGSHLVVSYFDRSPPEQGGQIVGDISKTFTGLEVTVI